MPLPELLPAFTTLRAQDEQRWTAAVTHVIGSLLAGLGHAHGVTTAPGLPGGVVHGAVRPDMASVGAGGNVRLRGFGASFDEDPSRIADRAGHVLAYAPPEGLGLRVRNLSLDLWGVGTVLHELLDGAPFRGDLTDVPALYRAAMSGSVAPPRLAAPEPLERMRQWLLAKQARERPRSCAEALAALPSAGPGDAILAALVLAQGSGASTPAAGPSMFDAFAASHSMPPQVRPSQPVAQSLPSMPPVSLPYSAPAPAPYSAPAPAPYSAPAPPPYSSPAAMRMPPPEDEGTVQIDEAMLAAMRAGTAPPTAASRAPAAAASDRGAAQVRPPEPMMPPPAARSTGRSAPPPSRDAEPSMIQPGMHQPAAAPGAYRPPNAAPYTPQGSYPPAAQNQPGSYRPGPPSPASSHPGAAPARSRPDTRSSAPPSVRHDPGPLDFQPSYEPTTMTVAHERRSTRNFVLVLVAAAGFAIAVGIGVGYLIVGDEPVSAPPSKAAPSEDAPAKGSGSPAPPAGDGPVLQPRAP